MEKIFLILIYLLSFAFLNHAPCKAFPDKIKDRLNIKSIGYSPVELDSMATKIFGPPQVVFSESVLNSLNNLGLVSVKYMPDAMNFQNPNTNSIKNICSKYGLDVYLISKIHIDVSEKFLRIENLSNISADRLILSIKVFDKNGIIINEESYKTDRSHYRQLLFLEFFNLMPEAVSEVISALSKGWNIIDSEFPIEQLTQKTWQTYKLMTTNGVFKLIDLNARLNLHLFKNSSYYLESTPDSSKRVPGDYYSYSPSRKEIILHSKNENLTFYVLGFNEEILILLPKSIENIQKIYLRYISEKEVTEMLKPHNDTIKSDSVSIDPISGKTFRTEKKEVFNEKIFFVVEESASFRGGDLNKFRDYIFKNTVYPKEAQVKKMSGKAIVQFVIGTDGSIKFIKIIRSSGYEILDSEAIRVISSSPKWKPGRQGGKAVNQLFTMPVSFVIE
jgi:TonB family protein